MRIQRALRVIRHRRALKCRQHSDSCIVDQHVDRPGLDGLSNAVGVGDIERDDPQASARRQCVLARAESSEFSYQVRLSRPSGRRARGPSAVALFGLPWRAEAAAVGGPLLRIDHDGASRGVHGAARQANEEQQGQGGTHEFVKRLRARSRSRKLTAFTYRGIGTSPR